MSSCDPSKQVPFSGTAAAKQAWENRSDRAPKLLTEQDFIDFLHTGFDDMFEIAAVPDAVMARMGAVLEANRPVSFVFEGPTVVDGDIFLTIVTSREIGGNVTPHRTTIVVRPEGTHDVWDKDEVSRR